MPNIDDMISKVQALIANADHPNTPPEMAANYRAKAEALMFKYKIDSLTAPETFSTIKPIAVTFDVGINSPYEMTYRLIARLVADHVGARITSHFVEHEGRRGLFTTMVGFESDVRYAQLLFQAAKLVFAAKLEPTIDRTMKSDAELCFELRQAGWEGARIALLLWGANTKSTRSKARRLGDAEAKRRGEPTMQGLDVKAYRDAYELGFRGTLHDRLARLRATRGEGEHALVLANAREAVDEMFYIMFPSLRPLPENEITVWIDPSKTCAKCAKSARGLCREHYIPMGRSSRGRAFSEAGYARGGDAARSVDLGPTGTQRIEG